MGQIVDNSKTRRNSKKHSHSFENLRGGYPPVHGVLKGFVDNMVQGFQDLLVYKTSHGVGFLCIKA